MKSCIRLFPLAFILLFGAVSCNDDNKDTRCIKIIERIGIASQDLLSEDCEIVVEGYNKLIDLYDEGRDCSQIKQGVVSQGFDDVDDYLTTLAELRDDEADACSAP